MRVLYKIHKYYTRFVRALLYFTISFFGIAITAFLLLQHPKVQNYVAQEIVQRISTKLDTKVSISHVDIGFFKISLKDFYLEDQQQDTLLFVNELKLNYDAFDLFSRDINLEYLELNNGVINLKRLHGQEDFNYAFIEEALKSDEESSSTSADWHLNLTETRFNNVQFNYLDEPKRQEIISNSGKLIIDFKETDINEKIININTIKADKTSFVFNILKRKHIKKGPSTAAISIESEEEISEPYFFNPNNWKVTVNSFDLQDGHFQHKNLVGNTTPGEFFNPNNIEFDRINLKMKNLSLEQDTILAKIEQLNTVEPKGFIVRNLAADVKVTPTDWSFSNLLAHTPNSVIKDYFAFSYSSFDDFYDFYEKMHMKANFDKSRISLQDLRFFAPGLPKQTEQLLFSGEIAGTIEDISGKDIIFKYGNQTEFLGKLSIFGLPNLNETFIDFTVQELVTNKYEFEELLPFIHLPPNTIKLGTVKFKGNFSGFLNDFVAYGDLSTQLGHIHSDINMKLNKNGVAAQYSGNLRADNFNLGVWMNEQESVGKVSFNVKVNGQGIEWKTMSAKMEGKIQQIDLLKYNYKNVAFNGELQRRFFSGKVDIVDPNLDMAFTGTVNFQEKIPVFKLVADIDQANLHALGFVKDVHQLKSDVLLDFKGSNINNIEGEALLTNTFVTTSTRKYSEDSIRLNSVYTDNGKLLTLNSGLADLKLEGRYNTTDMPAAFSDFMQHFYPSFPYKTSSSVTYQDFGFQLLIKQHNTLVELLLPGIKGVAGTYISGRFDNSSRSLLLDATIPQIEYENHKAENLNIQMYADGDTLLMVADVDKYILNNSFVLPHNTIKAKVFNDQVLLGIKASDDSLPNRFLANLLLRNNADTLILNILNSKMVIANQEWLISGDNELQFANNNIYADNLFLQSDKQKLLINSVDELGIHYLRLDLENVNLNDITNIVEYKTFDLGGNITGNLMINDLLNNNTRIKSDLVVTDFEFNGDNLGKLDLKGRFDPESNRLDINAVIDGKFNNLYITGNYIDNEKEQKVNFLVNVNKAPFNLLEPFIEGIASDLKGEASGKIKITGVPSDIDMAGEFTLNDASGTVNFLKTTYTFDPVKVSFNNNSIFINNSYAYDRNGNRAEIGGEISFTDFNNFRFDDVFIYTSDNFLFMDTKLEDNELFYGTAYGKGIVLINGPFTNINFYVNAKSDPNTRIFIPITYGNGVSQYDFIKFRQRQEDSVIVDNYKSNRYGYTVNMDLDVTTDAEVQLIFDMQTGDIIKGRGEGNLNINYQSYGDFTMYGNYQISEGEYLFTMQDVINKHFNIQNGGTITWTGDPYEARLNLDAIYKLRTSRLDLVSTDQSIPDDEKQQLKQPVPVEVHLHLAGVLSSPDIDFDIQLPFENSYRLDNAFSRRLIEIKSDERELNKQVFGLIVLNRFVPEQLGGRQDIYTTAGINTMTQFLSSQLSLYVTDWLSRYDVEVNLNYSTYSLDQQNVDLETRMLDLHALELEFKKKVGRFSFNIGGNFDFGNSRASEANPINKNVAGDFEVEYSLTPDGRVKVKAFSTSEIDIFEEGYRYKNGVGIFYKKEFDSFKDLFSNGNKKKEEPVKKEEPPTEPEIKDVKATDEKAASDLDDDPIKFRKKAPAPSPAPLPAPAP